MTKFFVGALLLLGCLSGFSESYAQVFSCNPKGNQQEINACAESKVDQLGEVLKKLYQSKVDALQDKNNKALLERSQKAWESYMDARCNYEAGPKEEGGSIWSMQHNDCLAAAMKERIAVLKNYILCDSPQKGCPY